MSLTTDHELVMAAQLGDKTSFSILIQRYTPMEKDTDGESHRAAHDFRRSFC
jgi:hypothetical protein